MNARKARRPRWHLLRRGRDGRGYRRAQGVGPGRAATLVVNEITDETREALQDGTVSIVIGTPLRQLCAELIPLMIHTVENGMAETPGERFLPFEIWTPESLVLDAAPKRELG